MFGGVSGELLLIILIALCVLSPEQLLTLAHQWGRMLANLKRLWRL